MNPNTRYRLLNFRGYLLSLLILATILTFPQAGLTQVQGKRSKSLRPFQYTHFLTTTGKLNPNRKLTIKSKLSEDVVAIPVPEGTLVDSGVKLLQFDTTMLTIRKQRAYHRMKRAEHQKNIARKTFRRKQSLKQRDLVSQSEFDQSKLEFDRAKENLKIAQADYREAQTRFSYTTVKSPFSGVLDEHLVEIGDRVQRAQPLLELIQLNPLELEFEVTPEERKQISTGDTVWFKPGAEWDFESSQSGSDSHVATVVSISHETNDNGLYPVRAKAENPEHRLIPGKTVSIRLPLERIRRAVKIPLTFVDRKASQPRAVLLEPDRGSIHQRNLTIIDYQDDSLIVKLDWPEHWKLIPGGVYTDSSGSNE